MTWSWLGLLLGFLLPLLVYLASYFTRRHLNYPHKEIVPALLAGFAALCSSITLLFLIFSSAYWKDGTRIVWTGMQAHDAPLVIGGKEEETVMGWPNEATFPKLKVVPRPNRQAAT